MSDLFSNDTTVTPTLRGWQYLCERTLRRARLSRSEAERRRIMLELDSVLDLALDRQQASQEAC